MVSIARTSVTEANEKNIEKFWDKMSPTMESMLLIKDEELIKRDLLEVLDYLPECKGKRILELNAGIGRFTGLLAKDANHVTAVDFKQKFLDVNKIENEKHDNITFKCANATKLDFPEGSFDLVLSGWLNTHLNNQSTRNLMESTLKWLAPGGHIVFREQCQPDTEGCYPFEGTGYYRSQLEYCQILQNVKCAEACFGNICTKTSLAYLHGVGLPIECHFMAKRVSQDDANCLMNAVDKIYTIPVISKLEWMFGQSWINPGGEETTKKLISQLGLTQDDYVLNLGSGTGGAAFHLAKHYSVNVHAVDLSANMTCTAMGRFAQPDIHPRNKIQFEAADITEAEFQDDSYDAIFSSNSIFLFEEKQKIFTKLYRWLKPGGKLLIADYCKGNCKNEFQELLDNFAINLMSIKDYEKILKDSGFGNILVKDDSENFSRVLQKELKAFNTTKDIFVEKFSKNEFCDLVKWASNTLNWVESKQLAWGIFWARKC